MKTTRIIQGFIICLLFLALPIKSTGQFFISGGYQGGGHGSGGDLSGIETKIYKLYDITLDAYPNPFNDEINFEFNLKAYSFAEMDIYDITNRRVRVLIPSTGLAGGDNRFSWDGKDKNGNNVPRGIYYCRLKIDKTVIVKKIIRL